MPVNAQRKAELRMIDTTLQTFQADVIDASMEVPVVLRSHGGRPRAVMAGDVHIDVAFIAAPTADKYGNMCGTLGKSACGSLGYAFTDADSASDRIALADARR